MRKRSERVVDVNLQVGLTTVGVEDYEKWGRAALVEELQLWRRPGMAINLEKENNLVRLRAIRPRFLNLVSRIIPTHEDYEKLFPEERRICTEELPTVRAKLMSLDLRCQSETSNQQRPMTTSLKLPTSSNKEQLSQHTHSCLELPARRAELKNSDLHCQCETSSQQHPMAASFELLTTSNTEQLGQHTDSCLENDQARVSSRCYTQIFSQSPTLKDNLTTSAATTSNSYKHLHLPKRMMEEFLTIAEENTQKKLETCGILAGSEVQDELYITALIIPQQESTSDACCAIGEEQILRVQQKNLLQTLGWIHTHPTQLCFMSSVDLHTQLSYQLLKPEAIAIVMAPTDTESPYGIFHLCKPHGLSTIGNCQMRGFHEHEGVEPIFERCSHVSVDPEMDFTTIDLRCSHVNVDPEMYFTTIDLRV